jgi:hypothetical protein
MAQQGFEGMIRFKITYPGSKLTQSQQSLFPKELTVMIKGPRSRTDIQTGGGNRVEITDHLEKTKIKLLSLVGQKYAIKYTSEDISKEVAREPQSVVLLKDDTRTIAGYVCRHAQVTVKDKNGKYTLDVYYNSQLGGKDANFDKGIYRDIDGVLLEFYMNTPEMNMRFTATEVVKKSISLKEFEIPQDFTVISKDELKNKVGSN